MSTTTITNKQPISNTGKAPVKRKREEDIVLPSNNNNNNNNNNNQNTTRPIVFVTGNKNKLKEVQNHLGDKLGAYIINKKIDLTEIQGTPEEIIKAKLLEASKVQNGPIMVEDTCLCFTELKELPGPYIKTFLTKLGKQGLIKLANGYTKRDATALCLIGFLNRKNNEKVENSMVQIFRGECKGSISTKIQGQNGFGWDPIFIPNENNTKKLSFAEITMEEKNKISHRANVLNKFKPFMENWVKSQQNQSGTSESKVATVTQSTEGPSTKKRKLNDGTSKPTPSNED